MSPEEIRDVGYESAQLQRIVDSLNGVTETDDRTVAFLAIQIHSFYNGVEKVLLTIVSQKVDGPDSHARLLAQYENSPGFPYEALQDLMKFRHVFRHAYFFQLDPVRILNLATKVVECWPTLRVWFEKNAK